ncbi:MAG TPA: thiamine pyrophosphate-dependent enzyme [Polyangiaceae bacterium]|jgi:pyruvate dehydrogenase E1 component alpha subunit/2-oxoisovalerate dehydrogenase E1 component alpha subunit|nr:thiamine pyrophosphate-dependent enzyme [Polyangiaceae bacterium]
MSGELALGLRLDFYRMLCRIRLLDTRMQALQRQGRIGFYGSCTGQEAVPVALGFALPKSDWIFPALRESSVMLVRGFSLETYIAQVFGNQKDVLKGRQMPSHMSGRAVNVVSWSSCIGTQLTHAVGAAWAAKIRRENLVSAACLGDGATSSADFHSALNFAQVFSVPCIFVCQNNQWAISTPASRQSNTRTFEEKARGYAMPAERVDGNDVCALFVAFQRAAERARNGQGPTFLECVTYRIGPHSTSDDPTLYRSELEVADWKTRDPILRLAAELRAENALDNARVEAIQAELGAEIDAALAHVESEPLPPRASLFDDVYAELPRHLLEQRKELFELQ